jgi:hypothetical protein
MSFTRPFLLPSALMNYATVMLSSAQYHGDGFLIARARCLIALITAFVRLSVLPAAEPGDRVFLDVECPIAQIWHTASRTLAYTTGHSA